MEWMPLKLSSLHLGINDPMMKLFDTSLIKLSMGYEHQKKSRIHFTDACILPFFYGNDLLLAMQAHHNHDRGR
jgi:hypothetical protein